MRKSICVRRDGGIVRFQARNSYYGKPRYDFVKLLPPGGDDAAEDWTARLLLIFEVLVQCDNGPRWKTMILVHHLDRIPVSHVPDAVTYHYYAMQPDVYIAGRLLRPIRLLLSPRRALGMFQTCYILLRYGRQNRAWNGVEEEEE